MGLFSSFRKKQQESSAGNSDFYSQADEEQPAPRKRRAGTKRDEPVDPVLPEKKRARRRLVGAVALVLAAVIGLPMILDSEPKPLSDDIAIKIPSRDTPAPARKTTAADDAAANANGSLGANEELVEPVASGAAAAAAVVAANSADAAKTPITAESAKPSVTAVAPSAAKTDTAEARVAAEATAKKLEAAAAKKAEQTAMAKKAEDAARARALLEGKPAAKPDMKADAATAAASAAKPNGKMVLQIAALASQDKVNELQKKLHDAGLKSYTQKISTAAGERIRVRVGPFATEAEAEKARAKLVKAGMTGKLVPA